MSISPSSPHIWITLPQLSEEDEKASCSRPIRKPYCSSSTVEKIIQPDTDHCPECDEPLHYPWMR